MRRLACFLIWLGLCQETGDMFEGRWSSPFAPLLSIPNIKLPIKLSVMDLLIIVALLVARGRPAARSMRTKPLDRAVWISIAGVLGTEIWGVLLNGGNGKVTFLQLHAFVMMLVTIFMVTACLKTTKDFYALGKTIVAAAVFRAAMAWWFYFGLVRGKMTPSPAYMTTHFDTVTFIAGVVLCMSYALETRTRRSIVYAGLISLFILVAVQLNNRRLAWVSLMCSIMVLYAIFPSNKMKKQFNRRLLFATPLLIVYVVVGTGRREGIFKPLRSLSSATGHEGEKDPSTRARDFENIGVVKVLGQHPILSTGWGHEYTPLTTWFSVESAFKETWYIPHNNMLMILCFNGMLGFMGIWFVFPVGVYFAARSYRLAETPVERAICAGSIAICTIYWNQMFGDMGFINPFPTYAVASAVAAAGRMATQTGAWPSKVKASLPPPPVTRAPVPKAAA